MARRFDFFDGLVEGWMIGVAGGERRENAVRKVGRGGICRGVQTIELPSSPFVLVHFLSL